MRGPGYPDPAGAIRLLYTFLALNIIWGGAFLSSPLHAASTVVFSLSPPLVTRDGGVFLAPTTLVREGSERN